MAARTTDKVCCYAPSFTQPPTAHRLPNSPSPAVHALVLIADGHCVLGTAADAGDVLVHQRCYRLRLDTLLCIPVAQLTILTPPPRGNYVAVCVGESACVRVCVRGEGCQNTAPCVLAHSKTSAFGHRRVNMHSIDTRGTLCSLHPPCKRLGCPGQKVDLLLKCNLLLLSMPTLT